MSISPLSPLLQAFTTRDVFTAHDSVISGIQNEKRSEQATTQVEASDESETPNNQNENGNTEHFETTLTEEEQARVAELKRIDREVRAHEQAHKTAGGVYVQGASFQYERGPDGVAYAVSGEVTIDTSTVPGDPAATLDKADTVRRAALAPAQPSGQDYAVAAQAAQLAGEAREELRKQPANGQTGDANEEEKNTKSKRLTQRYAEISSFGANMASPVKGIYLAV